MDKYKQSFPLCNLQATRIPSYSDDSSCGFTVGSLWGFEGVVSRCEDPSINNAIWVNIASSFNPTSDDISNESEVTGITVTNALDELKSTKQDSLGFTPENVANKDVSNGYAGLTLFKINFKNVLNTFTSFFTNSNTASRTYTFQDRNGIIADDTDLATKQATLTAANFATFVNSTTDKTTPVDADIVPIVDVSTGKRFSLSNLWTNYLKPKADAIYATISNLNLKMDLSMTARTIKLNKTASTASGINGSVPDLMELIAGATINAGTGTLSAVSTTNTKSIAFSAADIITGFASGSDGAYLFVQNTRGNQLVLNHEDGAETAANRIVTGGQNLSLGTYASVILQYKTSNNRWNIVATYGTVYWSFLAGTGNRALEVDANGVGSATKTFIDLYITDSTNITNLETTANWTAGVYGGSTIAGETKGKVYYGTLYMYVMITASTPKRIIYT